MSQENVEIVRRRFDAWNAGDVDGSETCTTQTPSTRASRDGPSPALL